MVHKKCIVCRKLWCYLLCTRKLKVKTETEKKVYIVIPTCFFFHIERRTRICPKAIQTSITLLSARMGGQLFYPIEEQPSFEVKFFPSPAIWLRRSGQTFSASDSVSLLWANLCTQVCLMSSNPPQGLDFPEDPAWDDLGYHFCLQIQKPEWHI